MREQPTFGPLLKRIRIELETSQAELARSAGYDHGHISRLEAGHRVPTKREVVLRLALALDLCPTTTNTLLVAAGFVPTNFPDDTDADPLVVRVRAFLATATDAGRERLEMALGLVGA